MIIELDRTGTPEAFRGMIDSILENRTVRSLIILAAQENRFTPELVDPVLTKIPVPVFGGIFPAIIHNNEKLDTGTLVVGLPHDARVEIFRDFNCTDTDHVEVIDRQIPETSDADTMFVFVDGFACWIGTFIGALFNVFGLENNYIGAGAGTLSMKQTPCLFTTEGLLQDCAVLALLDAASGVGISHGWEHLSGPFRVTQSHQNVIHALDWKPAFQVYKEEVDLYDPNTINRDNFFKIARAYPLGIAKIGAEQVVRDPVKLGDDDSLVCIGEVPEGTYVNLLRGDEDLLVNAASNALELAENAFTPGGGQRLNIFIDCFSRVLFLKNRFGRELNAIYKDGKNQPLIGACTIGEIANSGSDYLEFYNKTAVVAILEV